MNKFLVTFTDKTTTTVTADTFVVLGMQLVFSKNGQTVAAYSGNWKSCVEAPAAVPAEA